MKRITHNTAGAMIALAAFLGAAASDTATSPAPGLALLAIAGASALVWGRTR